MENKQATLELGTKPVALSARSVPCQRDDCDDRRLTLLNIVDRVFIGQGAGAMAISGLAITFPS